jgi:hypothetical protein
MMVKRKGKMDRLPVGAAIRLSSMIQQIKVAGQEISGMNLIVIHSCKLQILSQ